MQLEAYRRFTESLIEHLRPRDGVLGLVALGSMAEQNETPDDYSDHDFFVIVEPMQAEHFRGARDWLPEPARLSLHYRETAHGVKAIYDDGHLIEFAVFTLEEIYLARVNRYRVLFDHADVESRMAAVSAKTRDIVLAEAPSDEWLLGQLLSESLVGALRAKRGELIAGADRLNQATRWFLKLADRHVPTAVGSRGDNLDVLRRAELVHPSFGQKLAASLTQPAITRAMLLLDLAERELAPRMSHFPSEAFAVVRSRLGALDGG